METKVLNKQTGRYVKASSKLGKSILALEPKIDKESLLTTLHQRCNNTFDPISLQEFSDMTIQELSSIIEIGNEPKKNGYLLVNIYEVYKTAVQSNKLPKDPMNPSHTLTLEEIDVINTKMREINQKYKPPIYKQPPPYPDGYSLIIEQFPLQNSFFQIHIQYNDDIAFDLGLIPGWVESSHTGSADYTTGVLLSNIHDLWDKRILMKQNCQSCLNVGLKKHIRYWTRYDWKDKFIALCDIIKEKVESI